MERLQGTLTTGGKGDPTVPFKKAPSFHPQNVLWSQLRE